MIPPQECIDKASLLLNPCIISMQNNHHHIDPYNRLTIHPTGAFHTLSVHAEWFDLYQDYQWQLAMAIYQLIKVGLIIFPDNEHTIPFIFNFPYYFILRVTALEFSSNFRPDDIALVDDAVVNGNIIRYFSNKIGEYTPTTYSGDCNYNKGRKSLVIDYDKEAKDIETRKASRKEWSGNPYKRRLEFRLYANNCKWLNWANLRGNYFDIFKRYSLLLATIFNNYIFGNFSINSRETKQFRKVMRKATEIRPQIGECRYRGPKLKQMEPIPSELAHPETITAKQYTQFGAKVLEQFDTFSENAENRTEPPRNLH